MMNNKFGRSLNHLKKITDRDKILDALQAIEDLFTLDWLKSNQAHRLQILWSRKDCLATSELYSLGSAIIKLKSINSTWLESTAKDIKKNNKTSHGLITEMIIIGSLSTNNGKVQPCPKSFPTYDYFIEYESDFKYKVSIKNFDISIHEQLFNDKCQLIRHTFLNHLKSLNSSGRIIITIEHDQLTDERTKLICFFIAFQMKKYGVYYLENGLVSINYSELDGYDKDRIKFVSDTVLIISKQHYNEQRNIESKIKQANHAMLKDKSDDFSLKQLIIRIGESTDFKRISSYIKTIADDYQNCGFDFCLLYQPSLASDFENNFSNIHTSIQFITKAFFFDSERVEEKLKHVGIVNLNLGVGTISTEVAPLLLFSDSTPHKTLDLSKFYSYQRGDIFLEMVRDSKGFSYELIQQAPGITIHPVYGNLMFYPKIFPNSGKLLIV